MLVATHRIAIGIALLTLAYGFATAQIKPAAAPQHASEPMDAAAIEVFEKNIRPILVQQCFECHSHKAGRALGGIYLDSRAGILQGGKRGTSLVPGHPDKSLLVDAISYSKPELQMPPKGKLPDAVIADITEWVKQGAHWPQERDPAAAAPSPDAVAAERKKRSHWAWQPVRKVQPPVVRNKSWPVNTIDRFILAKLEATRLTPNPAADRRTLIRRATYDLIGLPPTPQEVEDFANDKSPDAWKKVIDRLLANPHYGERWGRYWLDVARYGEDQAHSFEPRLYPQGFRFRDWVARSLNEDMPYDRFVKEQIAADLLDGPDKTEQLPALGFFACGPVYYGDSKMFDQYDDRIDTLSRGFLGLTVACARCHDHKFDPITQKDYYALAGVFASTSYVEVALTNGDGQGGKAGNGGNRAELIKAKQQELDKFLGEQVPQIRRQLISELPRYVVAVWKLQNHRKTDKKVALDAVAATEGLDSYILGRWQKYLGRPEAKSRAILAGWRTMMDRQDPHADLCSAPSALAETQKTAADLSTAIQALIAKRDAAEARKKTSGPIGKADLLDQAETETLDELVGNEGVLTVDADHLDRFLSGDPKAHFAILKPALDRLKMGSFVHALADGPKPANIHVLLRGNPATPGDEAPRRFLAILSSESAAPFAQGSGRLELANAIADKNNPLTARVMVNRIWQHHFGRGIVRTASNFGLLGEPPTHPELLDYLASRFVEQGWLMKAIHREIMLSATYQMSSRANGKGDEIDPDDRLLWRIPRRRLEIEPWRDSVLQVAGKLDLAMGGPSVSLASPDNNRRTYYAAVSRHDLDSMLRLFDFPDPNATTDARTTTTVPLQQLFVLNSDFMVRQSKALAARLTAKAGEGDAERIKQAFALLYNRAPQPRELALGLAFLQAQPSPSATLASSSKPGETASKLSRWEEYAQVLLSANEFMYVD